MNRLITNLLTDYLTNLKNDLRQKELYEPVIASILKVHTDLLLAHEAEALYQIVDDIHGLKKENDYVMDSIYCLCGFIMGTAPMIRHAYMDENTLDSFAEWDKKLTGEIYTFIDQNH